MLFAPGHAPSIVTAFAALPVSIIAASLPGVSPLLARQSNARASCYHMPGDDSWPSLDEWQRLNSSVGGRLIAGRPLAEACYGTDADAAACELLRETWTEEQTYFPDPVSIMSPKWLNNSCTPFVSSNGTAPSSSACTLGYMPSYAINVSTAQDVVEGIKFARGNNVRIVVKNTGHDYQGRSAGAGSLSLWTHNLKEVSWLNYTSDDYTGPAVRLGTGAQAYEVYAAADAHGLRVTGGLCPTVALAGGFVAGAGHGPLMGRYGLAADNTLEFEVVTPDGGYMVATPHNNSDLFWALNGGGGGAYGVVLSQTTRAHADGPVVAATLSFSSDMADNETFWEAVDAWHDLIPSLNSIPGLAMTFAFSSASGLAYITLPDGDETVLRDTIAPFVAQLDQLKVTYTNDITEFQSFYERFAAITSNLPYGDFPTNMVIGGRLIPLSTVSAEEQRSDLVAAIRSIVSSGLGEVTVAGNAANLSVSHTGLDNAVHPAWRTAAYSLNINTYWDPSSGLELLGQLDAETQAGQDKLRSLTPGSGTYMNEATAEPLYWKEDYYGANYDRLLEIKKTYDSQFQFYGPGVVGSDFWTVESDGRLCRAE